MTRPPQAAPGSLALWLPRVLTILLGLYSCRAFVPFSPVEGDEQGVINGVQAWIRGSDDFAAASYYYDIQPGSYQVISGLHRLTGAAPLPIFGALSALAAVAFIAQSSLLLARAADLRPAWVAVALLCTQEFTAAGAYANTSVLAAVPVMAGLLVAQRARTLPWLWLAGILVGLGGWLRADSLLIAPAVLALRWSLTTPVQAIKETAQVAVVSAGMLVAAYLFSGASFATAWSAFHGRDNFSNWQMLGVNGWLVLGYAATLISLAGLVWLAATRCWSLMALVVAAGSGPLIVYGGSFVSPKYLHSAAPFLLLPALILLRNLLASPGPAPRVRQWIAALSLGLAAGEGLVGLQTSSAVFRRFDPASPAVSLATVTIGAKTVHLGLGEGEILQTADGPRLRGGQAWAPGMWRREKTAMLEEVARLDGLLQANDLDVVITSTYLGLRMIESWLRNNGFTAQTSQPFAGNPSSYRTVWQGSVRSLTVVQVNHTAADAAEFAESCRLPGRLLFVNDRGGVAFRHLAADPAAWQLLSSTDNRLLTLYLRAPQ